MKTKTFLLIVAACFGLNAYPQATSLTVDNQTPGWLSSKISYGDQQTVENLKVTGYLNGTDIQFIYDLNTKNSLGGVIDLEDVNIVSGGTLTKYPFTIEKDNELPFSFFSDINRKHIQKFIYPKSLTALSFYGFQNNKEEDVDSIIWTSTNIKEIQISQIGYSKYVFIPEGIEGINNIPPDISISIPSTVKAIGNEGWRFDNLTIFSNIKDPLSVSLMPVNHYYGNIYNSTFYIPKGTMDKYLQSAFATMKSFRKEGDNYYGIDNKNRFIEYYDIDSTVIVSSMILYKDESASIEPTIYPDDAFVSKIDYTSDNINIVQINSDGKIYAIGYGETKIHATPRVFIEGLETKTGTCIVKVIAHTTGIQMPETMSMRIGEQIKVNALTLPLEISDNQMTFSSNENTIAKVTNDGTIIGLKQGTCTITATSVDGGYTAECVVTVLQPVEDVTLEKHSLEIKVGDTENMSVQVLPTSADNKKIVWTSSDEQLATVNSNGQVTALQGGTVWIKATAEDNKDATDSCRVTVMQPVTGIKLSKSTYRLINIGDTTQLEAIFQPNNATNKETKWQSSNESVCYVSNGNVVATGYGTAVIMAVSIDGNYMASCVVNVGKEMIPVESIELSQTSATLTAGETMKITATVKPDNATEKQVVWTSSDETICLISQSGMLVGIAEGTATITATSEDGKIKAECIIKINARPDASKDVNNDGSVDSQDILDIYQYMQQQVKRR